MIVNIPQKSSDDPNFLTSLNGMLANLVDVHKPGEIYFVRIEGWFDHKWLNYSGRARAKFDGAYTDPVWREKLTFPPFNPNRVVEQISFLRMDEEYLRNSDAPVIHNPNRSHSAQNLQNRLVAFAQSGLFVWFSSDTANLDHASLMSYSVDGNSLESWFVSFRKKEDVWQVHQVEGIGRNAVQMWFPLGHAKNGS